MACYISTRNNRLYAAVESSFGTAAAVTAANRFTALSLRAQQEQEKPRRRDKTGSRTYQGIPGDTRKKTSFVVKTYLYGRDSGPAAPRFGALLEGALGAAPQVWTGGLAVAQVNGAMVSFSQQHGLRPGSALTLGGELRFVSAVPDGQSAMLNAPFTSSVGSGTPAGGSVTFAPAADLPSVTVYDYWSPGTAAQRLLRGAVVDELDVQVNGDFHELTFTGKAADLVDNKSFQNGMGGLPAFPAEPTVAVLSESPVPGHLGQVWVGGVSSQIHTLASARILVRNNVDFRVNDFGALTPRCIVNGNREVLVDMDLYGQDSAVFDQLYQAARSRSPLPLMLQLGETAGALCGIYLPSFIPAVPEFRDDEPRLRWRLQGSQALGTAEDEIYVAFG